MKIARLRQLTYISHMALGYSGAMFFVVLTIGAVVLFPRIEALLATSNNAASNVVTASGVWANSAVNEANQVNAIARDTRASIVATGRLADKLTELAGATKSQVDQVGPMLSSVKTTADGAADLLASTKGTTDKLPPLVGDLRAALQGIPPIELQAQSTLSDFDKLLASKSLSDAIAGVASTTQNTGKISGDLYVYAHPILNPDPCTTTACRWKKGLAIAGSVAGFGSNLYGAKSLITPLSVKVKK